MRNSKNSILSSIKIQNLPKLPENVIYLDTRTLTYTYIRGVMNKLYTASEARKRLGDMSTSSFKRLVDSGKIRKVVPPGKIQGKYIREDVDKLAEAMEQFVQIYSASEPIEKIEF